MENITVADIMTRNPIIIKPETNLLECAKKMVKNRVGSLLITEGKKFLGIINQKDILWALVKKSKKDLSKIKAIDISPRKTVVIKPSLTIYEAAERMKRSKSDKLPVIYNNELVGVVTAKDILNFHPEFYPELEEFAKIREEKNKLKRIKAKERIKEGICERCGNHDFLYKIDGLLICESCRKNYI